MRQSPRHSCCWHETRHSSAKISERNRGGGFSTCTPLNFLMYPRHPYLIALYSISTIIHILVWSRIYKFGYVPGMKVYWRACVTPPHPPPNGTKCFGIADFRQFNELLGPSIVPYYHCDTLWCGFTFELAANWRITLGSIRNKTLLFRHFRLKVTALVLVVSNCTLKASCSLTCKSCHLQLCHCVTPVRNVNMQHKHGEV